MQQVQVSTKFLNALLLEWSKFVTYVKLAKSLYTTYYDQLFAYLSQHEKDAQEVRVMRERYPDPLALVANYNPSLSPQHSVLKIHPPPQQLTPVYAEQNIFQSSKSSNHSRWSSHNSTTGQERVVKCYNCQGEKNIARQSTQPKRPRNSTWFKEKAMYEAAFQTEDLDAYDSDCDDLSSAKAVLMENLSRCDSDVLSETFTLEEESRSKMLAKQNDPISIEKKINI
nr:hypothetical protein [Tanacetum cinerariifolium]